MTVKNRQDFGAKMKPKKSQKCCLSLSLSLSLYLFCDCFEKKTDPNKLRESVVFLTFELIFGFGGVLTEPQQSYKLEESND